MKLQRGGRMGRLCVRLLLDVSGTWLCSLKPLRGDQDRAGCSPYPHSGDHAQGWPDAFGPKSRRCGGSLPIPLCVHPHPMATHLTEMENSPGALSLSRIRKAPMCLRWRSCSSARCREILPAYHLRGTPGSAAPAPRDTPILHHCTREAPRALVVVGAESPFCSLWGWDIPEVDGSLPPSLSQRYHKVLWVQTCPHVLPYLYGVSAASLTAVTTSCHRLMCLIPYFAAYRLTPPQVSLWEQPCQRGLQGSKSSMQDETLPTCIAGSC